MNKSINESKSSLGCNPLQPVPTINANLVAYRNGQGPVGQVFMIPRAVLIQEFYEGAAVPPWIGVAEQVLRAQLEAGGNDVWYLPPARRVLRKEAQVADFFQGLISWMQGEAESRSAQRVLYEAIRRLPGQEWFEETEGNAAYLQLWCRGIIQGAVPAQGALPAEEWSVPTPTDHRQEASTQNSSLMLRRIRAAPPLPPRGKE